MTSIAESPIEHEKDNGGRLIGVDVARCLAVFGMVFVNFRLAMGAKAETQIGDVLSRLFDGRASALFVVIAGVGVSLMSRRGLAHGDVYQIRISLLKRSLLLVLVGLLYVPIWPPDILHFYGVYLIAAAWILGTSNRMLLVLAALAVAISCGMILTLNYKAGWRDWESLEYLDFWTLRGMIRNTFFNGFHPFFPWIGFLIYGMWLGRQRLDRAATCWKISAASGTIAVVAELASLALIRWSSASGELAAEEVSAIFGTEPMPPSPLYMISATCTATFMVCCCIRLGFICKNVKWLSPFVNTGQLALTLYVAHVVIGIGMLEALGKLGNQSMPAVVAATSLFCICSVLFCHVWRKRFERGPLEAVFRRLLQSPD